MARRVLAVAFFAASSACGGSGGGGGGPPVPPSAGTVAVDFPTRLSLTDADHVVLRGTATAPPGVTSVFADGIAASTSDAFATWEAVVPLSIGDNDVVVTGTDGGGAPFVPVTVTVRRVRFVWSEPQDLAVAGDLLYLLDRDLRAVVRRNLVTGADTVVTSLDVGSGTNLPTAVSIAVDSAGGKAYVGRSGGVTVVDLATGVRSAFSDSTHGSGPVPVLVFSLATDLASNRLLGMDDGERLLAFDLATGNRTDLSSASVGSGPAFVNGEGMAPDPANGRAFVVDFGAPKSVVSVDLATGNRTVVSDPVTGVGPVLNLPSDVEVDTAGGRLLVPQAFSPCQVLAVDPATGNRSVLSESGVGTGPVFINMDQSVLDLARDRLLVGENARPAVMSVALSDGDRTDVWRLAIGSGTELYPAFAVAPSPATGRVYVAVNVVPWFVEVNLATGVRSPLAVTGASIQHVESVVLDAAGGRLLAAGPVGPNECVVSIDLATLVCTVLSGGAVGNGPALSDVGELVYDAAGQRVFVLDRPSQALLEVDLTTGDRSVVSDAVTGSGPALDAPEALDLDVAGGRALVMVQSPNQLLAVDLVTGDRTLLSGDGAGAGPDLLYGEVAFDAPNDRAIVTSRFGVQEVDLATGDRATLADNAIGAGPDFSSSSAQDAALDPSGKRVWFVDFTRSAVFLLDIASGERVIVAQ